jgi:ribosome-associated translation inhibitor RaiA
MEGKAFNSDNTPSDELKLGGNIVLSGFSLEPSEMIVVKKISGHYAKKISEKTDYQELRIMLKQKQKVKSFLHEISVNVKTSQGILTSESQDKNLYSALSDGLEKIYNQAEHKERTARQ